MRKLKDYLIVITILLNIANAAVAENNEIQYQAGVAISFDDLFVNEWYGANEVFREYTWKATFYISRFYRLSEEEIEKLHELKKEGHEIAAHGFHHIRATDYIAENGVQAWLDYEINPMMEMMHANNFFPTTFAYPYGNRNSAIDTLLLEQFKILRGTTRATPDLDSLRAFFSNSNVVYGLGIDSQRPDFNLDYVLSALQFAKDNNKILVIFGHKTVPEHQDRNETDYKTLVDICEFVVQNNMRFYTMDELSDLIGR
jgi:peptidoglycan/xylan/chitin deacetylase (PgdA/CDA1 family)